VASPCPLYDFCLLPAQFCYILVYIGKVESRVQIADRCATWEVFAANSQAGQAGVITDLISSLWRASLMLALNRSLVNRE
jgi:hypothetical protein